MRRARKSFTIRSMNPQAPAPLPTPSPVPIPGVVQPTILPPGKPAGKSNRLVLASVGLLLLVSLAANGWLYTKHSSDQKNANAAVAAATPGIQKTQAAADQAKFDATNKQPYKTYTGSATYGSISFNYPKTWSAYVDENSQSQPVEGYFYPGQVPGTDSGTAFALRVELTTTDYATAVSQMQSSTSSGGARASAYMPPKLVGVADVQAGTRFDGQIDKDSNGNPVVGSLVILKVRDKTLQISTQSNDYLNDFNNIILASLTYKP